MFKILSITSTLTLLTIVSYPSRTLCQTPSDGHSVHPQAGCLSGYPNGTYRGSASVTRNEFAVGLNECLNQSIPANRANLATKQDLEILLKRQRELNEQLRELNERVETPPAKK